MDETEAPIAPHAGAAGRAAGIMFVTPEGETLLLLRGDGGDFPRTFAPPAGHVEEGETDEQAARRETLEETGFAYEGPLHLLHSNGQFSLFIARNVPKFDVVTCDESEGFVWCMPDAAPGPLHPGVEDSFRIAAAHTEMDCAKLIRDGLLPSPQVFGNSMLFALRVTGTGQAYRTKLDEFVHRDESICLTPEYLERCILPVVWLHPESNKLDTKSYAESNIGLTILPYIKTIEGGDGEVWAIARIIDMVAALEMSKVGAEWSTSPGVVFSDRSGNATFSLDDGASILIEGTPYLMDHLAICERGVWDKEGPSEGVQVDQPIEVQMTEEEKAKIAAEQKAKADAQARADAEPSLADIMGAVKSLAGTVGTVVSRLDSVEKNMPAPTLNASADAARKDADDKAKADADMKAKADSDMKAKADADEKAKADADEKMKEEAAKADADEKESEAMADCQAKADAAYQPHGKRAPAKMLGEGLLGYRRRLARGLQSHSAAWKGVDLAAIGDSTALGIAETAIYADAVAAARNPLVDSGAPRSPRAMTRMSSTGHNITTFSGPVGGWMDDFRGPVRRLATIEKGDKQ